MPLTSSLYVHGTLTNTAEVLVDIGTGYFVEKARPYYPYFIIRYYFSITLIFDLIKDF
jgi:Prefoldin subunit